MTVEPTENPQYVPGDIIRLGREGLAVLKERIETYPTKNEWALGRWRVAFLDVWGNEGKDDYIRPISEVGVPNKHFPESIEKWLGDGKSKIRDDVSSSSSSSDSSETKSRSHGRGRPEGPMNRLKACNLIREFKKGNLTEDNPLLQEAVEWMMEEGEDKYLDKHYFPNVK